MRREQRPLESKTEQRDPISGAQNLSRSLVPVLSVQRRGILALIRARETERKHRRAGEFVC